MTESFFKQGSLVMSSDPIPPVLEEVPWTGDPVNRVLVVVSVLFILLTLKSFVRIIPSLRECLFFTRGTMELEHSVSKARMRNVSAIAFALPFFLIVDRYELIRFGFAADGWPARLSLPLTAGFILGFLLIRRLLFLVFGPKHIDYDARKGIHNTLYSFLVFLCVAMLLTLPIVGMFEINFATVRIILTAEIAFFYVFAQVRTAQVIASRCNPLRTIFLFAVLEIVPAVAAAYAYLNLCI